MEMALALEVDIIVKHWKGGCIETGIHRQQSDWCSNCWGEWSPGLSDRQVAIATRNASLLVLDDEKCLNAMEISYRKRIDLKKKLTLAINTKK